MRMIRALLHAMPLLLLLGSPAGGDEHKSSRPSACGELAAVWADITSGGAPLGQVSSGFCQADCGNGTTVSCSGTTCSAQDRNCSWGIRGSVTCGSQTYQCPNLCGGECTPGAEKQEPDGCCTPYKGRFRWYLCNSAGYWEVTPNYTCYGGCNPVLPD